MQNADPDMAFFTYAPMWMKTAAFGAVSAFQLSVGVAYANAPSIPEASGFHLDARTFVALASPCVTIAIGGMALLSKFWSAKIKMDHESQHDRREQEIEARQKAIEVRMDLLDRGVPCEHANCPIIEIAAGKREWDTLPPLKRPPFDGFRFTPRASDAKPSEDTVDLQ